MTDTLRSIAEGMEHEGPHCYGPNGLDDGPCWFHGKARQLQTCHKCRLTALLSEYEKVDLVKRWRDKADDIGRVAGISADAGKLRTCAAELETWLAVNLERIKAEARMDEAKWWSSPDREHGPRTLYLNEKERIATLEAQAKEKP